MRGIIVEVESMCIQKYQLSSLASACNTETLYQSHTLTHCTLQARQEQHLSASHYNFKTYLAYLLYPPLFLAGPVLEFRSFALQVRLPEQAARQKVRDILHDDILSQHDWRHLSHF